jgi:hypothetical protein
VEDEIGREAVRVALDGLAQRDRLHFIERGKIAVEHNLVAADQEYPPLDHFGGHEFPAC